MTPHHRTSREIDLPGVLRRLARAGDDGLPIAEAGVGAACLLGVFGLARIHGRPQRVAATPQGRAQARSL